MRADSVSVSMNPPCSGRLWGISGSSGDAAGGYAPEVLGFVSPCDSFGPGLEGMGGFLWGWDLLLPITASKS